MRKALVCLLAAGLAAHAAPAAAETAQVPAGPAREVVFVANAEAGTVSVVDARAFEVIREINVVPDGKTARLGEDDPLHALAGQRIVEAAGGTNLVQDQDVSPDGRVLYVSRGHRGDVAAFEIASGRMLWKVPIPGFRSDHMTLSRDGRRLYVSALTENEVQVIDTERAAITGTFATGEWPHDNHLSHDGERLYNASIGNVITPEEARDERRAALDAVLPAPYQLTVVDPDTLATLRTHRFERGIRPFVLSADESRMYAQLSHLHGLIEFDLSAGRITRRLELPVDEGVTEDDYDFEAPHHGLALAPDERTLCAAGRASDYVALVSTQTLTAEAIIEVGDAPGWAANGPDGSHCFVPNTRADTLSVISYAERREVARIPVGDGPKHIEAARIPIEPPRAPAEPVRRPRLRLASRCVRGGRLGVELTGDTEAVRDVNFKLDRRLAVRDTSPPFRRSIARRTIRRTKARRLRAVAYLRSGDPFRVVRTRSLRRCAGAGSRG